MKSKLKALRINSLRLLPGFIPGYFTFDTSSFNYSKVSSFNFNKA